RAILNRMEEICFNSALMREMRMVAIFTQLIDDGKLIGTKRMLFHIIDADDVIGDLAYSSKMNADWTFLMYLFKLGRERADKWLATNFDHVGIKSTVDLKSMYL